MEKKEERRSCLALSNTPLVWLALLLLTALFAALTVLMVNIEKENEFIITSLLPLAKKEFLNQDFGETKKSNGKLSFGDDLKKPPATSNEYVAKGYDVLEFDARNSAETSREDAESSKNEAENLREEAEQLREEAENLRDVAENSEDQVETLRDEAKEIKGDVEKSMSDAEKFREEVEKSRVEAEQIADEFEKPADEDESLAESSRDGVDAVKEHSGCPQGFTLIEGVCYGFFREYTTWDGAEASCKAKGGFLAEPKSPQENRNIVNLVKANGGCSPWIGASDRNDEGHWVWAHSRTSVTFTDWAVGEPNNERGREHCAHLSKYLNYHWNDNLCSAFYLKLSFVCQSAIIIKKN